MREETILYYVMPKKQTGIVFSEETSAKKRDKYKIRFPGRKALPAYETQDGQRKIVTVVLPEEAEKWKTKKLVAQMRNSLKRYPQTDRILMQPVVEKLLGASDSFVECRDELTEDLIAMFMDEQPERVVLLPGDADFPERQMEFFGQLLMPYLPKINYMTVLYADRADTWEMTDEGTDLTYQTERILKAVETLGDEMYYEYGLVMQTESVWEYAKHRKKAEERTLYLDGAFEGWLPANCLKRGDMYLDMASSTSLQTRIERWGMEINYLSPRKYLDTIVKSGYDILVNSDR